MTALTRPSIALACGLAGALVAHARTAHAQFDPWRLELHWAAPGAQCPDERAVLARVDALLGHSATAGSGDLLVARAVVAPSAAGALTVQLTTDHAGDAHQRDLAGTDCGALADATALMLAILVDPAAATIHAPAPVAAPVAPPPAPVAPLAPVAPPAPGSPPAPVAPLAVVTIVPEPIIPPRRRVRSPPPPRAHFVLRLDALADVGSLPSLAAGGSFAIGVRIDRVHVMLGALYFPPQRHLVSASPTSLGGDFQLGAGTLSACYDIARNTSFGLEGCALAEAGALAGTGVNVDVPIAGAGPWFALGPAVAGVWHPVPWLGLRAQLGAMFPVFRPPYVYESGGAATTVHQASAVTARGALGVEVYF